MKTLFNNVNFNSRSGPNGFALKLAGQLSKLGHEIVDKDPDVVLNFIQGHIPNYRNVLRLDGIWFNTTQDWQKQNKPIELSYNTADAVIVQSKFNYKLVTEYFGKKENIHIVNNGTQCDLINILPEARLDTPRQNNWLCASSWRPHKRLSENIKFFQLHANKNDVLYVAGSGDVSAIKKANDQRIKYVGDLTWHQLISLMKCCEKFLHLAYLDHCPNVVVDARATGCKIFCSSTGGTKEIAGKNAVIILEDEWDYKPIDLYSPPKMDFTNTISSVEETAIDMKSVAEKYIKILRGCNE